MEIIADFIHALSHSHTGGEVKDGIDPLHCIPYIGGVPDIPFQPFGVTIQIVRPAGLGSVHLFQQIVQYPDLIVMPDQFVRQMGTDETGPSRDEDLLLHFFKG